MRNLLVFTLALLLSTAAVAQKRKNKYGNVKDLRGVTEYNLVFTYNNIRVGKYKSEKEFLAKKMGKDKEKGEAFKKAWFADREESYEPKFITSFNKRFGKQEIKANKNLSTATHTMLVKTRRIRPGHHIGIHRQSAQIYADIIIYENSNPDEIIFEAEYTKVPGGGALGHDYSSGYRIAEGYAKLGKEIAQYLRRKTL